MTKGRHERVGSEVGATEKHNKLFPKPRVSFSSHLGEPQVSSHRFKPCLWLAHLPQFPGRVCDHFGNANQDSQGSYWASSFTAPTVFSSASNIDQVMALCFYLPLPGLQLDMNLQVLESMFGAGLWALREVHDMGTALIQTNKHLSISDRWMCTRQERNFSFQSNLCSRSIRKHLAVKPNLAAKQP